MMVLYLKELSVYEDQKGTIKYCKDENGLFHVSKRKIENIWNKE